MGTRRNLDRMSEVFYKPPGAAKGLPLSAQVAQLVEQRTENPCVGGSNPPLGTTFSRVRSGYGAVRGPA